MLDIINDKFADHPQELLYCLDCGSQFLVYGNCGDRTCPLCRYKHFLRLYFGYKYIVEEDPPTYLITLTLRNLPYLERAWVQSLRKNFGKLLRRVYYKSRIHGGMYAIECIDTGKGWHPHLHAIYSGNGISESKLKTDWNYLTVDSFMCDVTPVTNPVESFRYILKDFEKPPALAGKSEEYNAAFRRFRFLSKFGTWYRKPLHKKPGICPNCGQESQMVSEYWMDSQFRKLHEE